MIYIRMAKGGIYVLDFTLSSSMADRQSVCEFLNIVIFNMNSTSVVMFTPMLYQLYCAVLIGSVGSKAIACGSVVAFWKESQQYNEYNQL